jgi:hypothetical protein
LNENELKTLLKMPNERAIEVITADFLDENVLSPLVKEFEYKLFHLDGMIIKTKIELFKNLAHTMEFPGYFGHNWDALEECLTDLDWLSAKGYILLFSYPINFINNSPGDFKTFLDIVSSASKYWSLHKKRFLLILATENKNIFTNMFDC